MPRKVYIAHGKTPADLAAARDLATELERDNGARCFLEARDIDYGQNRIVERAKALRDGTVLILLTKAALSDPEFTEIWSDAVANEQTVPVRCEPGLEVPPFLRGRKGFDLSTDRVAEYQRMRSWLGEQPFIIPPPVFLPPPPRLFFGRQQELARLHHLLTPEDSYSPGVVVGIIDMAGTGKSALAKRYAWTHAPDFAGVYWLDCSGRNLASIVTELELKACLPAGREAAESLEQVRTHYRARRNLVVLDNANNEDLGQLLPLGLSSLLVTTQYRLSFLAPPHANLPLDALSEDDCVEWFRRVLQPERVARHEPMVRTIISHVERLPEAIHVATGLLGYQQAYTLEEVAQDPPPDVTALLRRAVNAASPDAQSLLKAMAACAASAFRLTLAAEVANMDMTRAIAAQRELFSRSLLQVVDPDERRYKLHSLLRSVVSDANLTPQHATAVAKMFQDWKAGPRQRSEDWPDLVVAIEWVRGQGPEQYELHADLVDAGFNLASRVGRLQEAMAIVEGFQPQAEARGDRRRLQACYGKQASILMDWGRLDDAMMLLKQQEAICLELTDRAGLQRAHVNQAIILMDREQFDDAMVLLKKTEAICLELNDRRGLYRVYGNQAIILTDWHRLEDAMSLHKRQEAICQQLGDRGGEARARAGMALIQKRWGNVEEALRLAHLALEAFEAMKMPAEARGAQLIIMGIEILRLFESQDQ